MAKGEVAHNGPASRSRLVRPPADEPNNPLRDVGGSRCPSSNEVLFCETHAAVWSPPGETEEERLKK
uniref:hypothetical protein n=1 Tax=Teichococcus vastitatis TaxID=2307076 RepID=UPI0013001928